MELSTIAFVITLAVLIVGGLVVLLAAPYGRIAPHLVPFGATFGATTDTTPADARV